MYTIEEIRETSDSKKQLEIAQTAANYIHSILAENPNLVSEVQIFLIQNGDNYTKCWLSTNPNLIPELFPKLFLEYKEDILRSIEDVELKYKNPETQALLEKYLLLV